MKVSDAVVEVAARVFAGSMWDTLPDVAKGPWLARQRAALEAALPMVVGEAVGRISGKPIRVHQFNEPVYWLYTLRVEDSRSPAAVGEPVSLPPGTKLYTAPPPSAVPEGMIERIKAAEQRIIDGHAPRRIPADPTDVDLVLAEVRLFLEGKPAPFWLAAMPKPGVG